MRRGRDFIGMPVLETGTGRTLACVKDVVFSPQGDVRALLVSPAKGIFRKAHAVPIDAFDSLSGEGALIPRSRLSNRAEAEVGGVTMHGEPNGLCGRQLVTDEGRELGTIADVIFDASADSPEEDDGTAALPILLWGFEVSDGIVKDLLDGRPVVEAAGARLGDGTVVLGTNGGHMNLVPDGHPTSEGSE